MSTGELHKSSVDLQQSSGFCFKAAFGAGLPELAVDEPEPIGTNTGPSPEQLLATAAGYCLTASLNFAMGKFRQDTGQLTTHVETVTGRNEENRMRVLGINVDISLGKPAASFSQLDRILSQFENFCTVAGSIKKGIPVRVTVKDSTGTVLHQSG
jgi:uncharacterized OsmC-like protein